MLSCYADDTQTPTNESQVAADKKTCQRTSQEADALWELSKNQLTRGNETTSSMTSSRSNIAETKAIVAEDKEQTDEAKKDKDSQ
jgi:hypothetical protein